jgi:K+-sensing histidine kinase KdpD
LNCVNDGQGGISSRDLREARQLIEEMKSTWHTLYNELEEARAQIEQKENQFDELARSAKNLDPRTTGLFNESYTFGRFDVVRLSQLISSRLEGC